MCQEPHALANQPILPTCLSVHRNFFHIQTYYSWLQSTCAMPRWPASVQLNFSWVTAKFWNVSPRLCLLCMKFESTLYEVREVWTSNDNNFCSYHICGNSLPCSWDFTGTHIIPSFVDTTHCCSFSVTHTRKRCKVLLHLALAASMAHDTGVICMVVMKLWLR